MKVRYKVSLIVVGGVALAIGAVLMTLGTIGRSRAASRVPVPSASMIEKLAADADSADSYAATVPATLFPNTRALDRLRFSGALWQAKLARIKDANIPVEYGPKSEPWGVRRFYVRDPFGKLINILQHE
jgi:catechol 2,3-dioxygenase-like lactoylglutathione lyase family enzyme